MMPSPQFIKSYFSSFTDDIISQPLQKGEKKDEDKDKEGEAAEVTGRSVDIYTSITSLLHSGVAAVTGELVLQSNMLDSIGIFVRVDISNKNKKKHFCNQHLFWLCSSVAGKLNYQLVGLHTSSVFSSSSVLATWRQSSTWRRRTMIK